MKKNTLLLINRFGKQNIWSKLLSLLLPPSVSVEGDNSGVETLVDLDLVPIHHLLLRSRKSQKISEVFLIKI